MWLKLALPVAAGVCLGGISRWEPERPGAKSLWLLPSGPDQVGDNAVRPTPAVDMAIKAPEGKSAHLPVWVHPLVRMRTMTISLGRALK